MSDLITLFTTVVFFLSLSPLTANAQWYFLSESFDSTEVAISIDSTFTNNLWQIGNPQKSIFDAAFSAPNAILTDTVNFYSPDNQSAFVIQMTQVQSSGVNLTFQHKYDAEYLKDGGVIEVSGDGTNWHNASSGLFGFNLLQSIYPTDSVVSSLGTEGFTGSSNGWVESHIYWNYPQAEPFYVRFRFGSDSNETDQEGWMIDNIGVTTDLGISIDELRSSSRTIISPNPASTILRFQSGGNNDWEQIELYEMTGRIIKRIPFDQEIPLLGLTDGTYLICLIDSRSMKEWNKLVIRH